MSSTDGTDSLLDQQTSMPQSFKKTKRRKAKAPESISSSTSTNSSQTSHPYLGARQASAIQRWTVDVPTRSTKTTNRPDKRDPIIEAYLEAKLALFRSTATSKTVAVTALKR